MDVGEERKEGRKEETKQIHKGVWVNQIERDGWMDSVNRCVGGDS